MGARGRCQNYGDPDPGFGFWTRYRLHGCYRLARFTVLSFYLLRAFGTGNSCTFGLTSLQHDWCLQPTADCGVVLARFQVLVPMPHISGLPLRGLPAVLIPKIWTCCQSRRADRAVGSAIARCDLVGLWLDSSFSCQCPISQVFL